MVIGGRTLTEDRLPDPHDCRPLLNGDLVVT